MIRRGRLVSSLMVVGCMAVLALTLGGCAGVKIVRIPIPVPAFGFGGEKEKPRTEVAKETRTHRGQNFQAVGIASWYGGKFHGRQTASGERYNMNAMTAAHRTLPFGTRVRVTNLENGRKAIFRINDRGPFIDGRIIDLSRAGARKLEFYTQGLTQVRIEVI